MQYQEVLNNKISLNRNNFKNATITLFKYIEVIKVFTIII